MTQSAVLDRIETVACAIEFLVHLIDEDMRSPDEALDAACALAEQFEPNAIVGYTTIDSRGQVATFQTAVYPRLPTFSKVHDVPIKRPYVGTCAQAICEGRTITCSNIATETGFDSSWRGLHGRLPHDGEHLAGHVDDDLVGVAVREQAGERAAAGHPVAARVVDDDQVDPAGLLAFRREAGARAAADQRPAGRDLGAEALEERLSSDAGHGRGQTIGARCAR